MRLTKRLMAVIGLPALLAGVLLAGSASSSPSISAGARYATVKFSAVAIFGTTTFTVDSTSCTLNLAGGTGLKSCFLSGSGGLDAKGEIDTAHIAITSNKGPITLSLSSLNSCLGVGSGAAVTPSGPVPVVADSTKWATASTVTATIKVYVPGNTKISCG